MANTAPITGASACAPKFPIHLTVRHRQLPADQSHLAPILHEIERFLTDSGMSAGTFGKKALGDPRFVFDLRAGRDPSSRICERARYFMRGEGGHA